MSSKKQALIERLMFLGQMESTETALFHQKAAESYGLGVTDLKAVSALLQEGSMTAGQVGERLHITTGAVTNLVDRLEKRGILRRVADPNDRRKVIIEVNPVALYSTGNPYESMGQAYTKLLDTYTEKELEFLVGYHERQIEMTKEQIAKLPKSSTRSSTARRGKKNEGA